MLFRILAAITVALVVLIAFKVFITERPGIPLRDEWKESRLQTRGPNRRQYLLLGFVAAFLLGFLVTGRIAYGALALPAGWFVAGWLADRKEHQRFEMLKDQYTQVTSALMTSLQGGSSPYQALEETVTSLSSPAREIFVEILRRNRTGVNYSDAIAEVEKESGWDDLSKLYMAFSLYNKTGCNLVEVFAHLLKSAYESKADRKYVQAVTAQIRATTVMLSFMAPALIVFMRFMAPDFAAPLFDTLGGFIVLALIGGMILLGNRLVNSMMERVMGNA